MDRIKKVNPEAVGVVGIPEGLKVQGVGDSCRSWAEIVGGWMVRDSK